MSDAKQPVNLCEVCRFAHNGHCFADPATDWCMKELLPRTAQAAPSDREKRLAKASDALVARCKELFDDGSVAFGAVNDAIDEYEDARAALADTTTDEVQL